MQLYHGSGSLFTHFNSSFARTPNDYYGGGLAYLTTSRNIAIGYANAGFKRTGNNSKYIYIVEVNFKKTFDVNHIYTGVDLEKIVPEKQIEQFARGANLLKFNTDKYSIFAKLSLGTLPLTGDQVFKGLQNSFNGQTSKVRDHLISCGFDSLRYNGGLITRSEPHDVYIVYDAKKLKITNIETLMNENSFKDYYNNLK